MTRNEDEIPECLRSLSEDELAKLPEITLERIQELLRQGYEDAMKCDFRPAIRNTGMYYR